MDSAESLRLAFAVALGVLGLSHIVQARAWAAFFGRLADMGAPGAFANALLNLMAGIIVVAFHPVYTWPLVLFTALGWAWVIKAAIYFIVPEIGIRQMRRGADMAPAKWAAAGVVLIVIAGLLILSVIV